jgi:hypothetical protein
MKPTSRIKATWTVVAALSAVGLGSAAAWPDEPTSSELAVGYSFVGIPEFSGWTISWTNAHDGPFGIAVNAAGYYAEGTSAHLLGIGPQLRQRGKSVAVFEQVVFAGAILGGDVLHAAVIYPGIGVDFAPRQGVGVRFQADWPLVLVSRYGVLATAAAPRFSAAIVFRPGLGRANPESRSARKR